MEISNNALSELIGEWLRVAACGCAMEISNSGLSELTGEAGMGRGRIGGVVSKAGAEDETAGDGT